MSLSKEHTVYCLSETEGWVRTKSKYDNEEEEIIREDPQDKIIEIKFVNKWFNTDYGNKNTKYSQTLFRTTDATKISAACKKFGNEPKQPYI